MKKTIFIIICLLLFATNVYAQNTCNKKQEEGYISLDVPNIDYDLIDEDVNHDILLGYASKLIANTYEYNSLGIITNIYEKEITEEELLLIQNNKNIHVLADGELHDLSKENLPNKTTYEYETNAKKITLHYNHITGENSGWEVYFENDWKTSPNKRSHDILAARWTVYKQPSNYSVSGKQVAYGASTVNYTESTSSDHINKFTTGAGLSMNLYDNYAPTYESLRIFSTAVFQTTIYATYQHATTNISLTNSLSYTMSSSGLGGVLNHSYSSSYDGMQGVYWVVL